MKDPLALLLGLFLKLCECVYHWCLQKKPKRNHRWSEKVVLFALSSLLVLNFCPCLLMLAVAHSGINQRLRQESTVIHVGVLRAVSKFNQHMLQSKISHFSHFHTFHQHLTSTNFAVLQGKTSLLIICISICDLWRCLMSFSVTDECQL